MQSQTYVGSFIYSFPDHVSFLLLKILLSYFETIIIGQLQDNFDKILNFTLFIKICQKIMFS